MFAQQTIRFKAILELLRSRGLLENDDDFEAFEHLVQDRMGDDLIGAVIEQYTAYAKDLGLQDSLPKPEPY